MSEPIPLMGDAHPPDPCHVLESRNLHVHYGPICALADVSFSVGCGHCVGLLGQNGAGKSTLLKTIAGLQARVTGEITWRGRPISEVRSEIAYLPQNSKMDPVFPMTVRGLVECGRYPVLPRRGRWSQKDDEVVEQAIAALHLEELVDRRLFQLSGGQLQRAHIARALAQEAHILLLDEPFSGLDEPSQTMLGTLLKELAHGGRLLIVCHHDLKAVPELFDTVLLLNRKRIAFGPTAETFTEGNRRAAFDTPPENVHV